VAVRAKVREDAPCGWCSASFLLDVDPPGAPPLPKTFAELVRVKPAVTVADRVKAEEEWRRPNGAAPPSAVSDAVRFSGEALVARP
jgi:hypothetical protein